MLLGSATGESRDRSVCACRVSGPGLWPLAVSPPFRVSTFGRCSLSGPRVPHPGVWLQPHLTRVFTRVGAAPPPARPAPAALQTRCVQAPLAHLHVCLTSTEGSGPRCGTPECASGWERLGEGKADLGESRSPAEAAGGGWWQGSSRRVPQRAAGDEPRPGPIPLGCFCWWTQCRGAVTGTGSEAGVPAFRSDPSSARPPSLLSSSSVKWAP